MELGGFFRLQRRRRQMATHQAKEDRKLAPDSNARVLRAAARAYDETEGVEHGTGHRRDLVGHGALLAHAYTPFARELQPEMVEHVRRIRAPNECISVLLIGNHSAGKSSFVNWYVGEPVQTTSVAMETAGITIVRRGKKRTTWRGKMTLGNFPGLDRVGQLPGVADHLTTEFCTSDKRAFRSLELIDTPGLVDGNVRYPFDVDAAMDALAEEASLIIVFLDPIGKALVGRCMAAVERLSALHHAKMHYVLSKMDTIADAHDRQSCVSQVAQELQSRVKGTHALKILQVYLPHKKGEGVGLQSKQEKTRTDPPNQLQELEDLLSVTVDTRAQEVVVKALEDCRALTQLGERILACDRASHGYNRGVKALQLLLWLVRQHACSFAHLPRDHALVACSNVLGMCVFVCVHARTLSNAFWLAGSRRCLDDNWLLAAAQRPQD